LTRIKWTTSRCSSGREHEGHDDRRGVGQLAEFFQGLAAVTVDRFQAGRIEGYGV